MPTEHITYSYKYEELSETAQKTAIETVCEKLGSSWWDQDDNDTISATIIYALAERLKSPGWDTYGEGDFPGIDGVELVGWSVDGPSYALFSGQVNRENAPALASLFVGVEYVELQARNRSDVTTIYVVSDEEAPTTTGAEDAIKAVIRECIDEAITAGVKEAEYKTSPEYALEEIEANEREFTEDGRLF